MSYARVLFREKNKKRTSRHVSPVPVTRVLLGCHARPVTRGESLSSAAEAPREGNHSYAMFMASWVILILLLLLPVLCEYVLHCKKGFPHLLGFDALQQVLRPHLLAQVLELHSGLQHRVHVHDDGCQADLRPRASVPMAALASSSSSPSAPPRRLLHFFAFLFAMASFHSRDSRVVAPLLWDLPRAARGTQVSIYVVTNQPTSVAQYALVSTK